MKHMKMVCAIWAKGRGEIFQKAENRFFQTTMNSPRDMARITQWILIEGRLEPFRLAGPVETVIKWREEEKKL